jgi:hypothetical protein
MNFSGFENTRDLANTIQDNTKGNKITNKLGTNDINQPIDDDISSFNRGVDVMTNFGHYHVVTEATNFKSGVAPRELSGGSKGFLTNDEMQEIRQFPENEIELPFGQGGNFKFDLDFLKETIKPVLEWARENNLSQKIFPSELELIGNLVKNIKSIIPNATKDEVMNVINYFKEYKVKSYNGISGHIIFLEEQGK